MTGDTDARDQRWLAAASCRADVERSLGQRIRHRADATEAVAEAVARLGAVTTPMDGDHVAAWLWVVGLRCWVNEWRHRQGVATHLAPVALGVLTAPGADEVVLDRELGVRVVAIVDAMPARTRAVLSALSDGVAPDEVGRRFGMQRNAVNVLVHRARAHVHRRLAAEERTARQGRT